MRRQFLMVSIVLLINVALYAQKDQIKNAEIEYNKGNLQDALGILKKAEYLIINATYDEKTDFYFLKGNVLKSMAAKGDMAANLALASIAYRELLNSEIESGKFKNTLAANMALRDMKSTLVNGAVADFKGLNYKGSAEKSYNVYLLDKKDTLNLFNAASSSMGAKDYNSAIKYYEELKKINYSGKGTNYLATNKKSKDEESFDSANTRDSYVAGGTYEKPRNEVTNSRRLEINKNLAYIYLEKNDYKNSEICYSKVIELDPKYIDAYINMSYLKLESKKALVDQMNSLGNTSQDMDTYDKLKIKKDDIIKSAIPYLKKALTIEPKNQDVLKSLLGVYRALDMTDEYNALKGTM